ncbi:MAG: thioredoxin domain-containing protein [Trueperaceae bacterium]
MTGRPLMLATLAVALVAVAALLIVPRLGGASADPTQLNLAEQPRKGAEDAPVQIVVFEDFLCPACGAFAANVAPRLEREFVATGDVSMYFKNFVVISPESERVAQVGECVFEQDNDAFWTFKEVAYRSQDNLDERRALGLVDEYVADVDHDEVRTCVSEDRMLDAVRADVSTAQAIGLRGTPSVLVDGSEVSASYEAVRNAIESALASQ